MIGYVLVGTNDRAKAKEFYNQVFAAVGIEPWVESRRMTTWGSGEQFFGVCTPLNGQAASVGNGAMPALKMKDTDKVDAFYAKAIELGAKDSGPPGFREAGQYYSYFRDLDGNKICAYWCDKPYIPDPSHPYEYRQDPE